MIEPGNNKVQNIYIELDVLLDTRLSVLAKLNPASAIKALESNYHIREEDRFPDVDFQLFKDEYAKRDIQTLIDSRPTEAINLLKVMCNTMIEQSIALPYYSGVKVFVNTYPYKLEKEELQELSLVLYSQLGEQIGIEVFYQDPKDLTPSYCKGMFVTLIMYTNYAQWLELHVEEFKQVQMPTVTLMVPAIFDCGKPPEEELEAIIKEIGHPFEVIEKSFIQFINLELIDIKYFSLMIPD